MRASVGVRVWPCVGAPSVTDVHSAPCVTPSLSPEPHRCVVNPVPRLCSQCPGPLIPSRFCSVRCLHVPPSPPCDEMWELEGLLCTSKYREGRSPERAWAAPAHLRVSAPASVHLRAAPGSLPRAQVPRTGLPRERSAGPPLTPASFYIAWPFVSLWKKKKKNLFCLIYLHKCRKLILSKLLRT